MKDYGIEHIFILSSYIFSHNNPLLVDANEVSAGLHISPQSLELLSLTQIFELVTYKLYCFLFFLLSKFLVSN